VLWIKIIFSGFDYTFNFGSGSGSGSGSSAGLFFKHALLKIIFSFSSSREVCKQLKTEQKKWFGQRNS
jgi:hypothetical protein